MTKYSKEFKEEALKFSDEIVVKKAATQLGQICSITGISKYTYVVFSIFSIFFIITLLQI